MAKIVTIVIVSPKHERARKVAKIKKGQMLGIIKVRGKRKRFILKKLKETKKLMYKQGLKGFSVWSGRVSV